MQTVKTLTLIPLIAVISCHHAPTTAPTTTQKEIEPAADTATEHEQVASPALPVEVPTVQNEVQALQYSEADMALAVKIYHWRHSKWGGTWYSCGKKLEDAAMRSEALKWANAINEAHTSADALYTYKRNIRGTTKYREHKVRVPLREVLGVIVSESNFDPCALGPNPRKKAKEMGLIKRKKLTLSYSLEELEPLFSHRAFRGTKADLGPGQLYLKIGRDVTLENYKEYLSIYPGVKRVFDNMARRGKWGNTRTPSTHWPNAKPNLWYVQKVHRLAAKILDRKYPSTFDG